MSNRVGGGGQADDNETGGVQISDSHNVFPLSIPHASVWLGISHFARSAFKSSHETREEDDRLVCFRTFNLEPPRPPIMRGQTGCAARSGFADGDRSRRLRGHMPNRGKIKGWRRRP